MKNAVNLPYFDILLAALDRGAPGLSATHGNHVHWGYWGPGDVPDGSFADFGRAAERLSVPVCDAAGVRDGARVLDAGSGLGGTLASLDQRFSGVTLTGLNIDARQVERAAARVVPRAGNLIAFHVGDACRMPFPDASFDAVLAVECIFHFPDRERFFAEARRVLRPGGRLALCDFVPSPYLVPSIMLAKRFFNWHIEAISGPVDVSCTLDRYRRLARGADFRVASVEDITRNTLPTYPVLRRLVPETGVPSPIAQAWIAATEAVSRVGGMRYTILSFEAPGGPA